MRKIGASCLIVGLMASPEGDDAVYQDVGGTFSYEFRGGDSKHIRPPDEVVREEKGVIIPSVRDRQGSKIVNADGYSGAVGQGDGECRPASSLARSFSCLTLEAASYPPFGAGFNTYPPIEAFQHFECACDTVVARCISVACMHDSRPGQEWHIDADGFIREGSAPAAVVDIRRRGGDDRVSNE